MPIHRPTAGYISLALTWEKRNWDDKCKPFIKDLKAQIDPADRSFNEETNEWHIKERCLPVIRKLWNEYFADPNQQDMFE